MPTRTKKQHYVPQFLLRQFATGTPKKPKIWVLDKSTKDVRLASVRDVAHENAFYEFHDPDGTHIDFEHLMEKIDSIGARIIKQVIRSGRLVLSSEDRVWLSYVVACQMSRTPMIRKDMDNFIEMIIHKWGPNVRMGGDARTVGEYGQDDSRFNSLMLLKKDLPAFAKLLQAKAWFLAEAPPQHPFIISDNPVTRHNMVPRKGRGNLGLNNDGIEIYLPISCRFSLHIVCPILAGIVCMTPDLSAAYTAGIEEGKPVPMRPENVTFANSCQVNWAERYVFGRRRDDLELPLDMLRTNPELMGGPGVRQRPDEE
ncbi:MAG: DUF4238 domain-containing protein [Verrucomicrobiota bacterium]